MLLPSRWCITSRLMTGNRLHPVQAVTSSNHHPGTPAFLHPSTQSARLDR